MAASRRSHCCSSPTGACAGCCAQYTNSARRRGSMTRPRCIELRIGIKRLRYAVEFFGPMIPGKSGVIVVKRLAGLQDELGQLNDLASAGTC
jgi:CHAD domain-containing protein